jgi:hypothetical protein
MLKYLISLNVFYQKPLEKYKFCKNGPKKCTKLCGRFSKAMIVFTFLAAHSGIK